MNILNCEPDLINCSAEQKMAEGNQHIGLIYMYKKMLVWISFILSFYLFSIRVLYPAYGTQEWIMSIFVPVSIFALLLAIIALSLLSSRRAGIGLLVLVIAHGLITLVAGQPMLKLFMPFEIFPITFFLAILLTKTENYKIKNRIFPSLTVALSMYMYVTMLGDILCSGMY